jgi:mRNA-degrading endonuclease RelE of RelBE toxin-antitoxin system
MRHELKSQVREEWDKLSGNDFTQLSGKIAELAAILQQHSCSGKAKALNKKHGQ